MTSGCCRWVSSAWLIALAAAGVSLVFLWGRNATGFNVIVADNLRSSSRSWWSSPASSPSRCALSQVLEHDGAGREYYTLLLFAIVGAARCRWWRWRTDPAGGVLAVRQIMSLGVYVLTGIRRDSSRWPSKEAFKSFIPGGVLARRTLLALWDRVHFLVDRQHETRRRSEHFLAAQSHDEPARWCCWRSGCCSSASLSKCRRCHFACGRPMPTKAPQPLVTG